MTTQIVVLQRGLCLRQHALSYHAFLLTHAQKPNHTTYLVIEGGIPSVFGGGVSIRISSAWYWGNRGCPKISIHHSLYGLIILICERHGRYVVVFKICRAYRSRSLEPRWHLGGGGGSGHRRTPGRRRWAQCRLSWGKVELYTDCI